MKGSVFFDITSVSSDVSEETALFSRLKPSLLVDAEDGGGMFL
jgi:hypothetical protein